MLLSAPFALYFGLMPAASAMHIMEGISPGSVSCVAWGVVCLPFLAAGLMSIRKVLNENRKALILLAMSELFIFVISSLKIFFRNRKLFSYDRYRSGVILFGPAAVSVLGLIVLLFQALLLAHGGLTTIGANTFSMAVAGPLVSFGIYKLCQKLKLNKYITVFLAAFLGDLFTYCVTAVQLALAHHADTTIMGAMGKFMTVFAPTQVPLAVIEGLITCMIIMARKTYAKPELRAIGFLKEGKII